MKLASFEPIFRNDIAPLYIRHQETFDKDCIHGCLHISRSLVIGNLLSYTLNQINIETNPDEIFYAIAFHDSGRQGNGIDLWEADSSYKCYYYLISKGVHNAIEIANMILKNGDFANMNYLCVYDADVLEIARPCTGVGFQNFDRSYIKLQKTIGGYYNEIIYEVFELIRETEINKDKFSDENSLQNLIEHIKLNQERYPDIYESLH